MSEYKRPTVDMKDMMIPQLAGKAKPKDFPKTHPVVHKENHDKLLQYLRQRLFMGAQDRDARIPRLAESDRNLVGWIKEDQEERKARRRRANTGKAVATDQNLPLTLMALDDAVTFFLQVFAPRSGFFHGIGKKKDAQPIINGFTEAMNKSAGAFGYYEQTHKNLMDSLKYNLAAFTIDWEEMSENRLNGQTSQIEAATVWAGNSMLSLDMYNTFFDPSCVPTRCYAEGEFFGWAEMVNLFSAQRMNQNGTVYNMDVVLAEAQGKTVPCSWYRSPISEIGVNINDIAGSGGSAQGYWMNYLGNMSLSAETQQQLEFVTMYIHITPSMFGLAPPPKKGKEESLQVWKFKICNDKAIVLAQPMVNMHMQLPVYVSNPYADSAGIMKSMAELMDPFQVFATFLLNTHKKAVRKNLWGMTYYAKGRVDLDSIPEGEVAARIPVNMMGMDDDIRKYIHHDNTPLDTKQNISDFATTLDILERFFPMQGNPAQIADIDRAIQSQVAAVMQGANGRKQKLATLIDEQQYKPARKHMLQNMRQFQNAIKFTDNATGEEVEFSPKELDTVDLMYMIGQGLKTLDRQQAAQFMLTMADRILQSQQGIGEIDIVSFLDKTGELFDVDVDITMFRRNQQQVQQLEAGAAAANGGAQPQEAPPVQ